jgi:hypothetical protein
MDALKYEDILSPEYYENLKQAAIDLKVREMMNAGCVWHIIWTGLVDAPFEFDRVIWTMLRCWRDRRPGNVKAKPSLRC